MTIPAAIRSTGAIALLISSTVLAAQKKPVTIEALTQRPGGRAELGGSPVWAPDGKRFAYLQSNKVMLYDIPSRSRKQLISLESMQSTAVEPPQPQVFDWQNRRVSEESMQWSNDGKELLIATKGDLFLYRLDSPKFEQLTATAVAERDAKLSPDAKRIAFRREHDLYTMDLASHTVTRLTHDGSSTLLNGELDWVYPEELDLGTAFWWSPDSQRIAYMQFDVAHEFVYPQVDLRELRAKFEPERYPQAGTPNAGVRIGVVAAAGGETRWMDLGDKADHLFARVYWTPDSRQLAVERLNRVQNELDLLLADAATGESHSIIHETDKYWINISDQFRFLDAAPARFVWSSERDGFRHLYVYNCDGKQVGRLTAGDWEVTQLTGINQARGLLYYVSTETSPLERQLYSVHLDGSGKTRVSDNAGTHSISMGPTADYYLDTFSSLTQPPGRTIHSADGKEWSVYREPDKKPLEEYEILPPEIVTVKAADGAPLYARLIKPANFDRTKKYPAIVMVYGGPGAQSVHNAWSGLSWDQLLAQKGFVIWELDNRGSAGRGHAFEAPLYRRFGETELADQRRGVDYLISQGYVDPARIGIYGWSYGGYMTLYSMLNAPDVFKVGIAGAPVTNWHNYDTIYTERYLGLPSENEEGYKRSSDVTYAANLQGKLLIVHNIEDDNVLFQNTLQMATALENADKIFKMITFPQKSHGVSGPLRKDLLEVTTEFFEQNLK